MVYKLYKSDCVRQRQNVNYPEECIINDIDDFKSVVKYDHMPGLCENNSRAQDSKFIETNIFTVDFDNDQSNNPNDWITIEDAMHKYRDFAFYLSTSKSHNIKKIRESWEEEKDTDSPRPRFHIYFLLDHVETDSLKIPNKEKIKAFDSSMDVSALGAKRFFYGSPNSQVYYNSQGHRYDILDEINKTVHSKNVNKYLSILEPKEKREGYKKLIPGQTTSEAQSYVADLVKRGLNRDEIEAIIDRAREEGYAKSEKNSENDKWWKRTIDWSLRNVRREIDRKQDDDTIYVEVSFNSVISMTEEDFNSKYQVVEYDIFANDISNLYQKTLYKNRTAYYRAETNEYFEIKQLADLYKKFVVKREDRYISAFYEWDKKTSVYRKIEKSIIHQGEKSSDNEKVFYIKDDYTEKNFFTNLDSQGMRDIWKEIKDRNSEKVSTTFSNWDKLLGGGFKKKSIYGVHGATGHGRSALLQTMAVRATTCYHDNNAKPLKVMFVETEMFKTGAMERMTKIYYNEENELNCTMKVLQEKNDIFKHLSFLHIQPGEYTADAIRDFIINAGIDIDLLLIDPFDDLRPSRLTEVEYINQEYISNDLARIAEDLNVAIFVSTQANREDVKEDGTVKRNAGASSVGTSFAKLRKFSGFWQVFNNDPESSYRGLTVALKKRDIQGIPYDLHFEIQPSYRWEELSGPQNVTQKNKDDGLTYFNGEKIIKQEKYKGIEPKGVK